MDFKDYENIVMSDFVKLSQNHQDQLRTLLHPYIEYLHSLNAREFTHEGVYKAEEWQYKVFPAQRCYSPIKKAYAINHLIAVYYKLTDTISGYVSSCKYYPIGFIIVDDKCKEVCSVVNQIKFKMATTFQFATCNIQFDWEINKLFNQANTLLNCNGYVGDMYSTYDTEIMRKYKDILSVNTTVEGFKSEIDDQLAKFDGFINVLRKMEKTIKILNV